MHMCVCECERERDEAIYLVQDITKSEKERFWKNEITPA